MEYIHVKEYIIPNQVFILNLNFCAKKQQQKHKQKQKQKQKKKGINGPLYREMCHISIQLIKVNMLVLYERNIPTILWKFQLCTYIFEMHRLHYILKLYSG